MKKLIPSLCFLFLVSNSWGFHPIVLNSGSSESVAYQDWTASANCMGAWFMNNDGGNETDRSGEGGTLVQTGGTIPTSATVPSGYSGTSRDFELGDTEYLTHADGLSTDISGTGLTIVAWVKHESSATDMDYVTKYLHTSERQYRFNYDQGDDALQATIGYNSGDSYCIATGASTSLDDTNWHHVAVTFDGSEVILYLDGAEDSNGGNNPYACPQSMSAGSSPLYIGIYGDVTNGIYDGLMDEVGIFNIAMSASQILGIKNNGLKGDKGASD